MVLRNTLIFILILFTVSVCIQAQDKRELLKLFEHSTCRKEQSVCKTIEKDQLNTRSDIDNPGSLLIIIYQNVVSSQDIPSCNFIPSCSQFAKQAINIKGFIGGVIISADRIIRCNGLDFDRYTLNDDKLRFNDPVENYILLKK